MRVAIEQASGEKYRSMAVSFWVGIVIPGRSALGERTRNPEQCAVLDSGLARRAHPGITAVDFYTVPHNINRVKEFFAKWYKKERKRHLREIPKPRRNAAAARAPMSRRRRWQKHWIC